MLTSLGVTLALQGTFFEDVRLGLHGTTPALARSELAGYGYARQPVPGWRFAPPPSASWTVDGDVAFPVAAGPWLPALSVGLWREVEPVGLLGSIALEAPVSVERRERLVLVSGAVEAAVDVAGARSGVAAPALRTMREGVAAAMRRVTHLSLHTATPATAANELRGTPGMAAAYAQHAAGEAITVTPELLGSIDAILAGDARLAAGYARVAVDWTPPEDDGEVVLADAVEWPAPPLWPVLQWQSGGRGAPFPTSSAQAWPAVAAVGLCEGAAGPVVGWSADFPGGVPEPGGPARAVRVEAWQMALFDRSRIAAQVV